MNFSAWAIRQPTPSILLFFMLMVAGLIAFQRLGIQSMPDMEFPSVSLIASVPGAAPEQLEAEVARPIEDVVSSIGSVRHVSTTINDGAVSLMIGFTYEKDTQEAVIDVRDAVARIRSTLPGEMQEPVVSRVEIAGLPMVSYAVSSERMDEADLSWFVDDTVNRALLQARGVAEVRRRGGVTREVRVELDPSRLQAQQVTPGEISTQLRRMQQEAPGGRGDLSGLEQTVRTLGTVKDAEALAQMSLPLADGRRLRLGDVARVRDTYAERRQLALLDGVPVVGIDIMRARGHDDVTTSKGVYAAIDALKREHPQVRFVEVSNTVDYSRSEYQAAMRALYEGCILAILVVWAFLRDWRATLVSAVALPLSIIPAFIVIMAMGYYLNVLTLLALILVIGILVDDAIVEVENIMRHLQMGKPPLQAAREAADEIGLAVIATSLTLVAVFLPTAFAGGMTGSLFRQFGWTASAAVLFSLLVARLLTPMMAAYLLKPSAQVHRDGPLMLRYLRAARWCLDHPRTTVVGAGAFFLASLVMIGQLPLAFIAGTDSSNEVAIIEGPPGSSLEQTRELAERARVLLADLPFVQLVYTTIGAGVQTGNIRDSLAAAEVRKAQLTARFDPQAGKRYTIDELRVAMREALAPLPGARVSIGRGTPGEKMNLMLAGNDPQVLMRTARAVETESRTLRGIGAVTSSASLQRPEIVIRPNFARAAELGITSAAIGEVVRVATVGDYDFNLPRMNLPGRQLYVRVQLDPEARSDPAMIGQLRVRSDRGSAVPLANIADISVAGGPAQIDRYDRSRVVTLAVDLEGRPIGDVLEEARALPTLSALPAGVREIESGDVEYMTEMVDGFMLAMLAGIFCVYAVMVLLFHDFGQPLTVLAALPLAATGALGLLWIYGLPLSMSALIGLLMLIGIVTKNSILLVDYAIMARRDLGMNRTDALLDACHKRARPIVMTTMAMGAGMMPIALVLSGDDAFRQPMALVVIGGLITSTVLSLLVVPVVFELVDEVKVWLRVRLSASATASAADVHERNRPSAAAAHPSGYES